MPHDWQRPDQGSQYSSWQRAVFVSRSFENHRGDRTILVRFHPNFEGEHPGGGQGPPTSSLSTNLTSGLAVRLLSRVSPCRKGNIHLQISMPSPGFKPRHNGTAISVANH
ncbi:hypothetical protein TNCV_153791 [Trichonephila clavipes]|nr:hypothetical protein TNCV_153791 [Trichonephila clavipes]